MRIVAVLAIGGLALSAAACGKKPENKDASGGTKYKACMVTDTGGIDDKSFNTSAWKGLQDAKAANGEIETKYVTSASETAYQPNLSGLVGEKCNLIIAVGGLMTDALKAVANQHPNQKFAIIDAKIDDVPNVYDMQFNTAQAGYLAGYLAAGRARRARWPPTAASRFRRSRSSWTGSPTASRNTTGSRASRWTSRLGQASQEGTFASSFSRPEQGQADHRPVRRPGRRRGHAGRRWHRPGHRRLGAGLRRKNQRDLVDQDGCVSAAQYCSVFLSTVVKNISGAVKDAVEKAAKGDPLTGSFTGTLANDGVSLAPYHDLDSKVPADLKKEIDQLKKDIIAGKLKVESPAQPK